MSVYYLPSRTSTAPAPNEAEWPSFGERLRNAWWRLRLALAEMRALLRSQPRYEGDLEAALPTVAALRPARVIDFEAARRRLRAVSGDDA